MSSRRTPRKPRLIAARPELIRVRRSRVHGQGVFARRRIRKGTRIIEYLGDRVSHREADRRYESKSTADNHTFLFIVDRGVVIDATHHGNAARFINHGCDPNCESVIEDRRVFIEAIRTIRPGEELCYDYQIGRDKDDPPDVDEVFACRCGAAGCRGSMLWPPRRPVQRRRPGRTAARRGDARPTTRRRGGRQ
ncbi:MAG: SET domain-containing protein-lysine N-methyltransferase [Gammaproteobacteria bacterium]|nr:SET domain-containing protein-lysine N-methyltransferase [Gammaproteobacteria bacterium]